MTPPPSPRFRMREATAAEHSRVDAAFAGYDLSDRQRYAAFLRAQAHAFLPVEAGIERASPETVLTDWAERRRSALLIADLATLGVVVDPPGEAPDFVGIEAALGAIYVLEGSRLGGRMLAQSVPEALPRSFLQAGDPALWRKLVEALDATLVSEARLTIAIDAARAVFARFEASARCVWES